ncbi:cupredoxin domain-containing protein [Rhodococcoides kroppenstedtii]|uniref:cupredoxin domain-containing protein n=1 Tax=Rhodococcoides kroppenstedtii TaxID=293050 RepID=UPI0021C16266|nr:cupredoxin family copper-binding protein [Rhodococcus kroppenstedtii]
MARSEMPHRRLALVGTVAALAISLTACTEDPQPAERPTGPNVVTVADMAYSPATVTISPGDTVTWFFDDDRMAHNVVGIDNASSLLHSPMIAAGQFSQTFDDPGTYNYFCTVHPNMTGVVIVR